MAVIQGFVHPVSLPSCPDCPEQTNLLVDRGERVCTKCGLVLSKVNSEDERRAYTKDEIDRRKQTEIVWEDFSPRTVIKGVIDAKHRPLTARSRLLFHRLSKIQNSLTSSLERNLWDARPRFDLLKSSLEDYLCEDAWRIYKTCVKRKLTTGRSINAFIEGSVYAAVKCNKKPITLYELVDLFKVFDHSATDSKVIAAFSLMKRKRILDESGYEIKKISLKDYANCYCSRINLPALLTDNVVRLIGNAYKAGKVRGRKPAGLIAGALYLSLKGERVGYVREIKKYIDKPPKSTAITQRLIAKYMGVTEVTLRSAAELLEDSVK